MSAIGRTPTVATSTATPAARPDEVDEGEEYQPNKEELFGTQPAGKPRKFILVPDPQRGESRVRVKVNLDQAKMDELPDSYRMTHSVYPRSYFPVHLKNPPGLTVPGKRYFRDDAAEAEADDEDATIGRVTVPAPSLDGESEVIVPRMSKRRHRKDAILNDLGYRMTWCQSRTFVGRMVFLQKSCAFFYS